MNDKIKIKLDLFSKKKKTVDIQLVDPGLIDYYWGRQVEYILF